jgi:hypothetical protein
MDNFTSTHVASPNAWQLSQSRVECIIDFVDREMQNSGADFGSQANKNPQSETPTLVRSKQKQAQKFDREE